MRAPEPGPGLKLEYLGPRVAISGLRLIKSAIVLVKFFTDQGDYVVLKRCELVSTGVTARPGFGL